MKRRKNPGPAGLIDTLFNSWTPWLILGGGALAYFYIDAKLHPWVPPKPITGGLKNVYDPATGTMTDKAPS